MKHFNPISLFLIVGLLFAGSGQSANAAPLGDAALLSDCFAIYMPLVSGGTGAGGAGAAQVLAQPPCAEQSDIVDFNGDGFGDLAIGVPGDTVNGVVADAGAVAVLYGTATGLASANNQLISEALLGIGAATGDHFGTAITAADFNGDGYTDLAVGAPGETVNGVAGAGQVNVVYGATGGLDPGNFQTFSQADAEIDGVADAGDHFGATLTSGDFNGDGFADLAIGAPDEGLEGDGIAQAGAVNILYGAASGVQKQNGRILHLGMDTVTGTAVDGANFGAALAAADFDNDGFDDLAVGIPGYDLVGVDRAGAVEVFNGSANGISLAGETLWRQGANSVQGTPEAGDNFGTTLAAGDFDNNGAADLAIGVPAESVAFGGGDVSNAGAVHVLYGFVAADGLSGAGDQIWRQGSDGIPGVPEALEQFGRGLVAADFNGDGADDLAISAPGYSGDNVRQGLVHVLYSNGNVLSTTGQDLWMQGIVQGVPDFEDFFGWALGAGDFDNDGFADLAAGVPYEDSDGNTVANSGVVNVIYGENNGLGQPGNQIWHQDQGADMLGAQGAGDRFGFALSQ